MSGKKKQTAQQAAFKFFIQYASYSYNSKTETPAQGRAKCARELARAERDARAYGFSFHWSIDWSIGSHKKFYGDDSAYAEAEPVTCEQCLCCDMDDSILASVGCVDNADSSFRRVVEAKLALEALAIYHDRQTAVKGGK